MRLYFAAAESALKELSEIDCSNILISMANGEKKIPLVPEHFDNYNLIIDSGAFSYFKKGGITLDKWIDKARFLYKQSAANASGHTELIGLDVIGNAEQSYLNWLKIIKEIPQAVPTFHVGSDIKFLKLYLNYTDRIAIGGMVPYKSEIGKLQGFLHDIYKGFDHTNLPKFHAFGYFSPEVLENYPFYSADASTWQNYSRFGEFHVFKRMQYLRMKSVNVEKFSPAGLSLDELHVYMDGTAKTKLNAIKKALNDYETFLTYLWKSRGIQF